MIAAGFGARVTVAGVIGRDEPGRQIQQLIADHDIEPHLWIDDRPTTWKQRIVARGHGMVAAERGGGTWYLPARDVNVRDVCGAGDTVLAVIAVSRFLANHCSRPADLHRWPLAGRSQTWESFGHR